VATTIRINPPPFINTVRLGDLGRQVTRVPKRYRDEQFGAIMRTDCTSSLAPAIVSVRAPSGAAALAVDVPGPAVAPPASNPPVFAAGVVAGVCPAAAVAGSEPAAAVEGLTPVSPLFAADPAGDAREPVISTWCPT
jgi:hypothetical protein